jgi:hypothetical protein
MGLAWSLPNITHGGHLSEQTQAAARGRLDQFADAVAVRLDEAGVARHSSPVFLPFSVVVLIGHDTMAAGFWKSGGMPEYDFFDLRGKACEPTDADAGAYIRTQVGEKPTLVVTLPSINQTCTTEVLDHLAEDHVKELKDAMDLESLGEIGPMRGKEEALRRFLKAHPEQRRNVFIMMRFSRDRALEAVYSAIRDSLARRGYTALRADERDFTGELWSNVQVYMTCCELGVAVFETLDATPFNPNVSLELGYMMAQDKSTLLLKERNLPSLPADLTHRLYKEFDLLDVEQTVERQIAQWIDIDRVGEK